jgi:DNA-directed RNA polymerase sigma subunit (sigma70/sigma32)
MKRGLGPLAAEDVKRIAADLNVKPEEVVEMETRLGGHDVAFEADDAEEAYAPVHYLAAGRSGRTVAACSKRRRKRTCRVLRSRRRSPSSTHAAAGSSNPLAEGKGHRDVA